MNVKIEKCVASGTIKAPPSKSIAHRMLIGAGLSEGKSVIKGIEMSGDISATINCLKTMGAEIEINDDTATIYGMDISKIKEDITLNCNESGSTLRFFVPLALISGKKISFCGSKTLFSRPLSVYEEIFKAQNINYSKTEENLWVKGKLKGGNYKVKGNISSQFISGLLFLLPLLEKDSEINIIPPIESVSYIKLTIMALEKFGIKISWKDERTLFVPGNQKYIACDGEVEGDYSNTAFFEAMNYLGSDIKIDGLNPESMQGDMAYLRHFPAIERGMPTINISDCPDLGPVLFALSGVKSGAIFTGTRRLKIKESDRAGAMAQELSKFGIKVNVMEDTVTVYPAEFYPPKDVLSSHNDHRIVMALTVLLMMTGGEIEGAEAVNKSFPGFFEKLIKINGKIKIEN